MRMVKKNWLLASLVFVLVLIVGIGMIAKYGMERAAAEELMAKFPDRGVPRMNITLNGVTLEEINAGSKDVKYEGNEVTVYEGDEVTLEASGVRVKGRGNGTWVQEKKPYQIKFDKKVDLFGMGRAKKWVLLANAMDTSNVRTAVAFDLAKMLDVKYTYVGEFVELYVNGEYEGLYYLTHAVEIGKDTIDLETPMGVLVELDNLYWDGERYYETQNGDKLVLKDVKSDGSNEIAMEHFLRDYNNFEIAVDEKNYKRVEELVDVESFVKYYLLSEFIVNPDAYWTSFYMYKDGDGDKIHAGPGWDFDLAFANRNWGNWMGEEFYLPTNTMIRKKELMSESEYEKMGLEEGGDDWYDLSLRLSHIMFDLMEMPDFRNKVRRVFLEKMRGRKEEIISIIDEKNAIIAEAARVNEEEWGKESFWREVETMKRWIDERYEYFDEVYGN